MSCTPFAFWASAMLLGWHSPCVLPTPLPPCLPFFPPSFFPLFPTLGEICLLCLGSSGLRPAPGALSQVGPLLLLPLPGSALCGFFDSWGGFPGRHPIPLEASSSHGSHPTWGRENSGHLGCEQWFGGIVILNLDLLLNQNSEHAADRSCLLSRLTCSSPSHRCLIPFLLGFSVLLHSTHVPSRSPDVPGSILSKL